MLCIVGPSLSLFCIFKSTYNLTNESNLCAIWLHKIRGQKSDSNIRKLVNYFKYFFKIKFEIFFYRSKNFQFKYFKRNFILLLRDFLPLIMISYNQWLLQQLRIWWFSFNLNKRQFRKKFVFNFNKCCTHKFSMNLSILGREVRFLRSRPFSYK